MPITKREKGETPGHLPSTLESPNEIANPGAGLEGQVRDLERLHAVTMRLARMVDRGAAMQEILAGAVEAVGASKGLLSMWSEAGGRFTVGASVGFSERFLEELSIVPAETAAWGAFARTRAIVEDASVSPRFAAWQELVRLGGFRAAHSVPLMTHDGRNIGVLTAYFAESHVPDAREERLMDLHAQMAADFIARDLVLEGVRESEERFRTLAANAPVGIFLSAPDGRSIFLNRRWCEMAGLTEADARGTGWQRAVHPEDRERVAAEWQRAVAEGRSSESAFRFLRPDGTVIWLHGNASALRNAAGEITGYIGTLADITESQLTQSAVRESEKRYRELVESLPVAVYTTGPDGRVELFNRAAVELWGRQPEIGTDGWSGAGKMQWPDGREMSPDQRPMAVALKTGQPRRGIEVVVERPDGGKRFVLANPHPFLDEHGKVVGGVNALLDITEYRHAHAMTRLYAAIVESSDAAILSKDLNATITSWNAGAERLFGYTAAEAIGQSIYMLIPADRRKEEPEIMDRIRRGERVDHYETVRRRKDGTRFEVSLTESPVKDDEGQVIGASKIVRTITQQKRVEAELRRQERLYRAVGDAVDFGIWIGDAEGRNVYLSDSFLRLVGMTQEECRNAGWARALHPDEVEDALAAWRECVRSGTRWEREHRYKGVDGEWHPVLSRGMPIRNDRGEITHWAGINLDISAYRRAEDKLRQSESQLRLVTDSAMVFIAQCDREHRLRFVNRPYAARFGKEPNELLGKPISDLIGAAAHEALRPYLDATLAGRRVEFELEIPYERFGKRWVRVIHEPERSHQGEVIGLVAVITDITSRKQVEREMEAARDKALAASRAKDDFLAALSHELRTPLNPALLIASEAADNVTLPEEVRADFRTIRRNIQLEARLIDDLLDMTRITRGKLALDVSMHDLQVLVRDALATMRPEFTQKKIVPEVAIGAEPAIVECDSARLQQVLWNVLKNAVKFTAERGKIVVRTWNDTDGRRVNIEVRDSGIGMTEGELTRAFEAFSQGDHAAPGGSHRFGGVGLGLAISRMLVEQHHGTIVATSEGRDKGSSFLITLPLMTAEERETRGGFTPRAVTRVPFKGAPLQSDRRRTVLLVEDHEPTRTAMEFLLKRRNFVVRAAGSVKEARQLAEAGGIDLVISDIGLPDGNGYELMSELRLTQRLIGIALTGYGMDHDIVRSQAAGFGQHLTKPVTIQALDKALAAAWEGAAEE